MKAEFYCNNCDKELVPQYETIDNRQAENREDAVYHFCDKGCMIDYAICRWPIGGKMNNEEKKKT